MFFLNGFKLQANESTLHLQNSLKCSYEQIASLISYAAVKIKK
jgi:hypothetical protein